MSLGLQERMTEGDAGDGEAWEKELIRGQTMNLVLSGRPLTEPSGGS